MLKSFLCGLTIGGVATLLAMQYHIVRTNERFVVVSRVHQPPLRSSYVDIRNWNASMWQRYPELEEALIKAGRTDLLTEQVINSVTPRTETAQPVQDVSEPLKMLIRNSSDTRMSQPDNNTAANSTGTRPSTVPQTSVASVQVDRVPQISPETLSRALPSLQRPVPCPEEIQVADSSPESTTPAERTPPKQDWVQSLLRTFVPATTASIPDAATTSSSSENPEGPAERAAVPEPLLQEADRFLNEIENSFPASPRRIFPPEGKSI